MERLIYKQLTGWHVEKNYKQHMSANCDTVVFEHGGPAFGSDKIPERDVKKFVKKYHNKNHL